MFRTACLDDLAGVRVGLAHGGLGAFARIGQQRLRLLVGLRPLALGLLERVV